MKKKKLKNYNKTAVYDIVICIAAENFPYTSRKTFIRSGSQWSIKKIQSMCSLINVNTKGVAAKSSTE